MFLQLISCLRNRNISAFIFCTSVKNPVMKLRLTKQFILYIESAVRQCVRKVLVPSNPENVVSSSSLKYLHIDMDIKILGSITLVPPLREWRSCKCTKKLILLYISICENSVFLPSLNFLEILVHTKTRCKLNPAQAQPTRDTDTAQVHVFDCNRIFNPAQCQVDSEYPTISGFRFWIGKWRKIYFTKFNW